jgi:pimeloyl-ACP methyl ester carboxylesterase
MTESLTLTMPDGRTVGYADFGPVDGAPVLWCHGGPGSRLEPLADAPAAAAAGYRFIGIDRPGYGVSTPQPGRTIGGWVPDAVAVLDALGIERCAVAGISTGGAYALALAAAEPERISGVVACCALTDMRWAPGKLTQSPLMGGIWEAPDRPAAMDRAIAQFGVDGSKMFTPPDDAPGLPPADLAVLADPAWGAAMMQAGPQMFAQGVVGYVDDRIADGVGWISFDVGAVRAPTIVLHGGDDSIVDVAQAGHTAAIVPGAQLRVVDGLGHLSIIGRIVATLPDVGGRLSG